MPAQPVSPTQLIAQLHALGVQPSGVLLVHCAFSKVKPVEGGPAGLIAALQATLGPKGTLVMPSMSWDDEHPFDPRSTLASKKWAWWPILSGAYRASCAATARIPLPPPAQATRITAPHPVEIPHGIDSPVGRVYELDGQVLLLGIGHSSDTTIHLAELLAGVCYRRPKSVLVRQGEQIVRVDYGENDHCCQNFALADGWLDAKGLQRRGVVVMRGAPGPLA